MYSMELVNIAHMQSEYNNLDFLACEVRSTIIMCKDGKPGEKSLFF